MSLLLSRALLTFVALSLLVSALPSMAEQKYYTWVDAQGNMHNTLITSDKSSDESSEPTESEINTENYPTEENFQQSLNDRPEAEKPFYTWTDAEGVIRSDVKPDVMIEFSATEIVYDAAFAPPFRLPDYVTQGVCCEAYTSHFSASVKALGSVSVKVDGASLPFKTQAGDVDAAYISVPDLNQRELLLVKAYKIAADSEFELIALSQDFKPLYLADPIKGSFVEETWKDLPYKKAMIEVSDPEIKHIIVFVRSATGEAKTGYTVSLIRDTL
mgnify:CR=1 FL=1